MATDWLAGCSRDAAGTDEPHPLAAVVTTGVTAVTLLTAFGLMALGIEFFWVAFVVGFGGVLPVSVAVLKYDEATGDRTTRPEGQRDPEAALEELQLRYARGEFTDAEFEQRVETLLETTSEATRSSRR